MKVTFKRHVVAGTERGGEDIFLRIRVETAVSPEGALQAALEAVPDAVTAALRELPQSEEAGDPLYSEQGRLKSSAGNYQDLEEPDFSKEDLDELVRKLVLEGECLYSLRTRIYSWTRDVFVDGNAD